MEYVKTNMGLIPLEDYYEMKAEQCGFDSYKEMREEGLFIEKPANIVVYKDKDSNATIGADSDFDKMHMAKMKYTGNTSVFTLHEEEEDRIKELLMYRKIVKVEGNTLFLDNGTSLEFIGNQGCGGCNGGWYDVTELNGCDNVITNVEFACDDGAYVGELSYKIFVYAEDKKIKLVQVDGSDGNGYYGTGYSINVKVPRKMKEKEQDKIKDDMER